METVKKQLEDLQEKNAILQKENAIVHKLLSELKVESVENAILRTQNIILKRYKRLFLVAAGEITIGEMMQTLRNDLEYADYQDFCDAECPMTDECKDCFAKEKEDRCVNGECDGCTHESNCDNSFNHLAREEYRHPSLTDAERNGGRCGC
jgi:hypothetical protein